MRRAAVILAAVAVLLAGAEIAARTLLGFPLIFSAHPGYEYLPQPNQRTTYRGITYVTDANGLRSPPFAARKSDDAFRVLVIGDSIVFGNDDTSQPDIAVTHLAQARLADGRRIEPVAIAANSWGPGNQLAFLDAHGVFDADAAILVISTHDIDDDRTWAPLNPLSASVVRSPSAALDWVERRNRKPVPVIGTPPANAKGDARRSLPLLLDRISALPSGACIVMHEDRNERKTPGAHPAIAEISSLASARSIPLVFSRDHVAADHFSDDIHLNGDGHSDMAQAFETCLSKSKS